MNALLLLLASFAPSAEAADLTVVGTLTRTASLAAGGTTSGTVVLHNGGTEPADVRVYPKDYAFQANGSNAFDPPGTQARSNSAWIRFTPSDVVVPAGQDASVSYVVTVPDDSTLEGTYWSTLMIEPAAPADAGEAAAHSSVSVKTVLRYALQVVTEVGGGDAELAFVNRQLVVGAAGPVLDLDVANTGDVWLTPVVWAEVFAASGASLGRFDAGKLRIYPGCSARFHVPLTGLPAGQYTALVVADNGDDHVFGSQYDLDLRY
jgi:hypothetical protein